MGGGQLFPDTAIIFFFCMRARQQSSKQDDNSATNYINSLLLIVEILWDTTRFVFKLLTDVLGHPFTSFFVS